MINIKRPGAQRQTQDGVYLGDGDGQQRVHGSILQSEADSRGGSPSAPG